MTEAWDPHRIETHGWRRTAVAAAAMLGTSLTFSPLIVGVLVNPRMLLWSVVICREGLWLAVSAAALLLAAVPLSRWPVAGGVLRCLGVLIGAVGGGITFALLWTTVSGDTWVRMVLAGYGVVGVALVLCAGSGIGVLARLCARTLHLVVRYTVILGMASMGIATFVGTRGELIPAIVVAIPAALIMLGLSAWRHAAVVIPRDMPDGGMTEFSYSLTVIMLLLVWLGLGGLLPPNVYNAWGRSTQNRTMSTLRMVATAANAFASDNGRFPEAEAISDLRAKLVPAYLRDTVEFEDAWGWPLEYSVVGDRGFIVRSPGSDGLFEFDDPTAYPDQGIEEVHRDLVWSTVSPAQWPAGRMRP